MGEVYECCFAQDGLWYAAVVDRVGKVNSSLTMSGTDVKTNDDSSFSDCNDNMRAWITFTEYGNQQVVRLSKLRPRFREGQRCIVRRESADRICNGE